MIVNKKNISSVLTIETGTTSYFSKRIRQPYTHLFIHALRHMEFHYNQIGGGKLYHRLMYVFWHTLWNHWSAKTGITIPKNVCEEGLTLYHYGSIVVNGACRIGRNCCIMNNVNIGANGGSSKAPQIGDNVYIGPGAVIYGDIQIADGCSIGANAVVNKSFLEQNSVIVGAPAKVIKYDNVCWWEKNRLNRIK